ncbi:MAG: PorV/PorQ family protein [Elusimicrobia bacterium]|nr:PorV/PorQ family protein [Elusimicrobiota bacterium]
MRIFSIVVMSLLLARPAAASDFANAAVGTTGSEFMLLDTSARGTAMGGAYSAATNDASSIYWNPAGLAQVPRMSATVLHTQYVAGITYNALAAAARVNDSSVFAAGVRYLDFGPITRTDVNGRQDGVFHPRSYLAELGWGQSIYDLSDSEMDMSVGVSVKYLHSRIESRAIGYGGDFGLLSRFYGASQTYDVSLTIQNLGVGQKFDQVRDSLPARVRFGGAVRPTKPLLLTIEAIAPINNTPHGAAGIEYVAEIDKNLKAALRAGANTLTVQSLGPTSIMTLGAGLTVSDLSFDYAYAPTGDLGEHVHRISVSFNLPAKVSRRYRER